MNRNHFDSAMDKIIASEEFKNKIKENVMEGHDKRKPQKQIWFLTAAAAVVVVLLLGIYLPSMNGLQNKQEDSNQFKITGKMQGEACYISVVYLDGYAYIPSEWLSYSRGYQGEEMNFEAGNKLGEVTIDLKGLTYKGTPPDFSSTYDVGTQIYEIKNVKRERAVLVRMDYGDMVFYRQYTAVPDENTAINLTVSEIMNMMTNQTQVISVELRSEEDGSWMRTSEEEELLSILNEELPGKSLLTRKEMGKDINSLRVPVNLMFEDGAALHIQFYPEQQMASLFGGYIDISKELANQIMELFLEGETYHRVTDLLPKNLDNSSYLYIEDHVNQREVLCTEPEWSGDALYQILKYYRVRNTSQDMANQKVMTIKIGESETDYTDMIFYEDDHKNIIIQVDGTYYETYLGHMKFKELEDYLIGYTDLGM
jgi:hypothetical protein